MARIAVWRVLRERIEFGRRYQEFIWHTDQSGETSFLEFRTEAEAQARAGAYNAIMHDGWHYAPFGVVR